MHPAERRRETDMAQEMKAKSTPKRAAVPLKELHTDPDQFQHRLVKLDNAQVELLAQELKRSDRKPLDPLTVWQDPTGRLVVVDGHHRVEAYNRAGWGKKVPVVIHRGTEVDAQFLTVADNGKARLQMSQVEKSNWAWRMVVDYPSLTAERIALGPVSLRNVRYMRAVKKRLEKAGVPLPETWGAAKMLDTGNDVEWDEEKREEMREQRRAKLLEEIRAPLALAAQRDPQVAMEVVLQVMGKNAFDSGADWLGYVEAGRDYREEDEPF